MVYANNEIIEKREELVYDGISLIAEFGGALGLFLGFSFFMVWDFSLPVLIVAYKKIQSFR